jgi:two-component SAPR family response regulator
MEKKILIIDDERDFCLIMKAYFIRKGYSVSLAYNIQEGLTMMKEVKPDILFLDNNLPDGNGWDIIDKIVEIFPHIQTYLVSAHRNYSPLNERFPNITVWEKPISMESLNKLF